MRRIDLPREWSILLLTRRVRPCTYVSDKSKARHHCRAMTRHDSDGRLLVNACHQQCGIAGVSVAGLLWHSGIHSVHEEER